MILTDERRRILKKINLVGGRIASVLLLLSVLAGALWVGHGRHRTNLYLKLEKGEQYETVVAKLGEPTLKEGVNLNSVYWSSLRYPSPTPAVLECRWEGIPTFLVWFDANGRVVGKHMW